MNLARRVSFLLAAFFALANCLPAQQTDSDGATFKETKAKAEKGDIEAEFKLVHHYLLGEGVEKNASEAMKWLRKAAEDGNSDAQFTMGDWAKDAAEAVRWFRRAAEQGDGWAQFRMGLCM